MINHQKDHPPEIPMEERNENLGDFTLNNDGDLGLPGFSAATTIISCALH